MWFWEAAAQTNSQSPTQSRGSIEQEGKGRGKMNTFLSGYEAHKTSYCQIFTPSYQLFLHFTGREQVQRGHGSRGARNQNQSVCLQGSWGPLTTTYSSFWRRIWYVWEKFILRRVSHCPFLSSHLNPFILKLVSICHCLFLLLSLTPLVFFFTLMGV